MTNETARLSAYASGKLQGQAHIAHACLCSINMHSTLLERPPLKRARDHQVMTSIAFAGPDGAYLCIDAVRGGEIIGIPGTGSLNEPRVL